MSSPETPEPPIVVSVTELRKRISSIADRIQQGAKTIVKRYGTQVAIIEPLIDTSSGALKVSVTRLKNEWASILREARKNTKIQLQKRGKPIGQVKAAPRQGDLFMDEQRINDR